jgi:outer membrane protein TolC
MKTSLLLPLVLLFHSTLLWANLSLKESFESALKTNQADQINETLIDQNIEIKNEAKGSFYPKLSLKGSWLKQERIKDDVKYGAVNLSHTLFKGGRDLLAVDSADKNYSYSQNQKTADQLSLYSAVISAYYNYFLNLNDLLNLDLLRKQSADRVEEIKKRVRVGRSRRGELLQAEAQLASAEAMYNNGEGLVKESQERFFVLTGLDRKERLFNETISVALSAKGLKEYLKQAFDRPDVKNKELKIDMADIDLQSTKAQHLPTLDLASNYYLNKRAGTYHNTSWDATLSLNIPFFEGGTTSAKVREYSLKKAQATYTLADYQRTIELDVTAKYETYMRYQNQIKAYEQALEKAKKSYDETLNDYRLGLVTNLDVLSALNLYLDSKRNNEKTKISAVMSLKLLESAVGVLP